MEFLVNKLPSTISPYARLMRLHQPIGIWLLLWPCWWSIALASYNLPDFLAMLRFAVGAIIMRSAGCVINDLWDQKIDAKVERTKNRPLASGELNSNQALRLFAGLLLAGLAILLTFNMYTISLGLIIVVPVVIYPLMKRITYWPQAFLGLVFNWGALMGWAALKDGLDIAPVLLYIGGVFWTLGYDTIYGHQDKQDDLLIGVHSTALKFGDDTKKWLKRFYGFAFFMFMIAGGFSGLGNGFYIIMLLVALHFYWQVKTVDLDDPKDCRKKFFSNAHFGWIMLAAIAAGKIDILNL